MRFLIVLINVFVLIGNVHFWALFLFFYKNIIIKS
nr:MAG TPA: hypothetical protein [Caudoviricetes sp.]